MKKALNKWGCPGHPRSEVKLIKGYVIARAPGGHSYTAIK